jgi:hypothetical protein
MGLGGIYAHVVYRQYIYMNMTPVIYTHTSGWLIRIRRRKSYEVGLILGLAKRGCACTPQLSRQNTSQSYLHIAIDSEWLIQSSNCHTSIYEYAVQSPACNKSTTDPKLFASTTCTVGEEIERRQLSIDDLFNYLSAVSSDTVKNWGSGTKRRDVDDCWHMDPIMIICVATTSMWWYLYLRVHRCSTSHDKWSVPKLAGHNLYVYISYCGPVEAAATPWRAIELGKFR